MSVFTALALDPNEDADLPKGGSLNLGFVQYAADSFKAPCFCKVHELSGVTA